MTQKDEIHQMKVATEVLLRLFSPFDVSSTVEEIKEANQIAVDAIEHRIPMKPYRNLVHYPYRTDMEVVQCPRCKRRLRTNRMTKNGDAYCPDCGQAIDWDPEEPRLQSDTILTEEVRDASDK